MSTKSALIKEAFIFTVPKSSLLVNSFPKTCLLKCGARQESGKNLFNWGKTFWLF